MKKAMALMALTILTACDYAERADLRNEQSSRLYREAMDDYRAGRLDAAISGFEREIAENPANSSARFQLACLLQDARRDFVGAYCGYREYLLQKPKSDRAELAKDRLATCEKEAAMQLAGRCGLTIGGAATNQAEVAELRRRLKTAEERAAAAERNLSESLARIRALTGEKDRLLSVVKGEAGGDEGAAPQVDVKEVRELLDEADEDAAAPAGVMNEFAQLSREDRDEESLAPPLPQPDAASGAGARDEAKAAGGKAAAAPKRPKTYVVVEGDTLYGVSKRFYGSASAWKKIRDANKALISTDNRLRAGDTLELPEP